MITLSIKGSDVVISLQKEDLKVSELTPEDLRIILRSNTARNDSAQASTVQPKGLFSSEKRTLLIYGDYIVLCGITVWTNRGIPDLRKMLLLLGQKDKNGYVHMSGPQLAAALGRDSSNPVGSPIKSFCDRVSVLLAEHRQLQCGPEDVISSKSGYHFREWIEVRVMEDHEPRKVNGAHGTTQAGKVPDVARTHEPHFEPHGPNREPDEPHPSIQEEWSAAQKERLTKICAAIKKAGSLSKDDIRRLCRMSRSQITRDLKALVDAGKVERIGPQKGRKYKTIQADRLANSKAKVSLGSAGSQNDET